MLKSITFNDINHQWSGSGWTFQSETSCRSLQFWHCRKTPGLGWLPRSGPQEKPSSQPSCRRRLRQPEPGRWSLSLCSPSFRHQTRRWSTSHCPSCLISCFCRRTQRLPRDVAVNTYWYYLQLNINQTLISNAIVISMIWIWITYYRAFVPSLS